MLEMPLQPETCFEGVWFLIHGSLCEMGSMHGRDLNWLIRIRLIAIDFADNNFMQHFE